jgi:hypothetical protein
VLDELDWDVYRPPSWRLLRGARDADLADA